MADTRTFLLACFPMATTLPRIGARHLPPGPSGHPLVGRRATRQGKPKGLGSYGGHAHHTAIRATTLFSIAA
ncbi:MAG TPA: hypothetical protein VKR06_43965 [Ktedonosporobacter sp.]|nr:hypothetical protein [Ktedonosporobacter sp.]